MASRSSPRHADAARARVGRDSAPEPVRVARAEGARLVDARGRRYLDLTGGWCVGNLGWGRRELRDALARFDGPDYVAPHFQYAPWDDLAKELCRVAPGRMARAFRATGGSEAVDLAIQAAMRATGRRKFVALEGCYHGDSLAAMAVAGEAPKGVLPAPTLVKPPLDEKALSRVETALRKKDVAAVVLEPIPINLGVEIPDTEFMHGVEQLCKEHGTLLVADEVATGFGRTGAMFACEHYDLRPDIVTLAKGLTGGVAPMGAMLMTKEVADEVEDDLSAYSTYGWHPLSVEVARANLRVWKKEGPRILRNVDERGEQMRTRLEEMDFEGEAEVRAKGLAVAVRMDDDAVKSLAAAARRRGVLASASGDALQMTPALTITEREVDEGMDALARCLPLDA